ncbi:MAG: DUF6502 family protein [Pseudohongiella sp.]|nr:DUF6502 family protein [Pseudohongiella sp.]MDO9519801.1 DUF6502 family protein [Pseudohongiella sp.]MDP2126233.1 DUF6502 family protein [Pseudohongiella sp.]
MDDQDLNISPGQAPEALVTALRKILRPVVRLMLHFQVSYPYLITLLKSVYVEVADNEFNVDNKRQSDSRITLLTGVHRKDVKRLRADQSIASYAPRTISVGAQLIAYWLGLEQFRGVDGKPLALPLRSVNMSSEGPYFDDLVELVCRQDIRPRVILDEWLRLGVAHQDEQDRVLLNTGAFTPDKGLDEKLFFFGKNVQDHINAGAHNILDRKPAFFDRSVYYDQLSAGSVEALQALANDIGMNALIEMNREALRLQQQDANGKDAIYRMNFGIFNYNNRHELSITSGNSGLAGEQTASDQDSDHA